MTISCGGEEPRGQSRTLLFARHIENGAGAPQGEERLVRRSFRMNAETRTKKAVLSVCWIFAAIFAFAFLISRYGPLPSAELEVVTAVLLIGCLIIVVSFTAISVMSGCSCWRNERKFRKTFGCFPNPPSGLGSRRGWKKAVQAHVDGVLKTLAKKLDDAFRQEEEDIRQINTEITPFSKKSGAEIRLSRHLLARSRRIVRREGKRFWDARGLAYQHGLPVKTSFRDYLGKEDE